MVRREEKPLYPICNDWRKKIFFCDAWNYARKVIACVATLILTIRMSQFCNSHNARGSSDSCNDWGIQIFLWRVKLPEKSYCLCYYVNFDRPHWPVLQLEHNAFIMRMWAIIWFPLLSLPSSLLIRHLCE